MIKVYLAGPDVFYPNCGAIFEERIRLCAALGLTALIPWSSDPRPLVARIRGVGTDGRDADGHLAEDFGLVEHLMIGESIVGKKAHATFEAAARTAAAHFKTQGAARKPARA
jgi:nucleoside 2-deoxyribosyltransferase